MNRRLKHLLVLLGVVLHAGKRGSHRNSYSHGFSGVSYATVAAKEAGRELAELAGTGYHASWEERACLTHLPLDVSQ